MHSERPSSHEPVPRPFPVPKMATTRRSRGPANDPISAGLRKLWQDVEHEPLPAEFFDLLDAIDAARAQIETPSGDTDSGKPS